MGRAQEPQQPELLCGRAANPDREWEQEQRESVLEAVHRTAQELGQAQF